MDLTELWEYDRWPWRGEGNWGDAARSAYDLLDFHVDLGCGKLPKARIAVDRYPAPGVNVVCDMDAGWTWGLPRAPGEDALVDGRLWSGTRETDYIAHLAKCYELPEVVLPPKWRLPFPDSSIKSIISSHFFEHVGSGFIPLVDDIWRVLEPGGILRAITPLFPSWSAVSDPDHKRYFMADENGGQPVSTWTSFLGDENGGSWLESFSVPYTRARFELLEQDYTARSMDALEWWTPHDARELRVALRAVK